jgi:hypothetical protein
MHGKENCVRGLLFKAWGSVSPEAVFQRERVTKVSNARRTVTLYPSLRSLRKQSAPRFVPEGAAQWLSQPLSNGPAADVQFAAVVVTACTHSEAAGPRVTVKT